MIVFCPLHKKDFLAPRRNPIRCENKFHELGTLDFDGRGKKPVDAGWEYCCNCEHFWPMGPEHNGGVNCPVCARQISLRYLCDRCYTISLESPSKEEIKNFWLTTDGAPQPACPGCLEPPAGVLREHECASLGSSLVTALRACPLCNEPIGDPPSFPSLVDDYLENVKRYKPVGIDYELNLLVPDDDGEFALILNGQGARHPMVLPRMSHFASKREFYETYQDFYHCEAPAAGRLMVLYPAVAVRVEGGWQLREAGKLEVVAVHQGEGAEGIQYRPGGEGGGSLEAARPASDPPEVECSRCGTIGSSRNAFCWHCGNPLRQQPELHGVPESEARSDQSDEAVNGKVDSRVVPSIFAAVAQRPNSSLSLRTRTLIVAGLAALVSFLLIALVMRYNPSTGETASPQATVEPTPSPAPPAQTQEVPARSADEELNRLRGRLAESSPTDRVRILRDLESAERKYPRDYRFPYERAKLSASDARDRREALPALRAAAENAIDENKANAMLGELMVDRDGEFRRLSRAREWDRIVGALRNKDRSYLESGRRG
jgi:hypothetical protein